LEQAGLTVTDQSVVDVVTSTNPPPALVSHLIFIMDRHLVAVEYGSVLMASDIWRIALHSILDRAAVALEYRSTLRLEPVPRDAEVIQAFHSFSRLTRLRVRLHLPNPELTRLTERLRAEMEQGAIREYLNDMSNPAGISQREGDLPLACAAMAQQGYKHGEVLFEGFRNGRHETVRTGRRAARGRTDILKDFLRGIYANAKTQEAKRVIETIREEVDRLSGSELEDAQE
jgi:hypothetical protein